MRRSAEWHDAAIADLGLDEVARALSPDHAHADRVKQILLALCGDPGVIAYRQDVLSDLLRNPALADGLNRLLPALGQLSFYGHPARPNEPALQQTIFRLGELELYVDCVQQLRALLLAQGDGLRAEGLHRLRDALTEIEADPAFQALRAELPEMLAKVRNIGSVTIGVNLDAHMMPSEATLLSINTHRFKGAGLSLLGRLLGKPGDGDPAGNQATQGLARLHRITLPEGMPHTRSNLMLVPLFKDLSDLLESVARLVADALARYARISAQFLVALEGEIAFYFGAIRLVRRIEAAGLPMCRPQVVAKEERLTEVCDLFNLNLALRMLAREPDARLGERIVLNDARFDDEGRVFILTGPNQGGKTTFIQAVGLVHILAQTGLPVPGSWARISPVDAIFTHFAAEERPDLESGRLGEEVRRLSRIFAHATRYSLILLNESLSSTSPNKSLHLARDVVRGLRMLGARVIFATHLHALAEEAEQINARTPGDSRVASLVSQTVPDDGKGNADDGSAADAAGRRTYEILPGPPQGTSFARDIARKYGISFEQIEDAVKRKD